MSKATSYRFPEETIVQLERLAERWGCSQSKAIQRAIRIASGDDIPNTPSWQRIQEIALITIAPGPTKRPDGTVIEWDRPTTTYQIQIGNRAVQVFVPDDLDHEMLDVVGSKVFEDVVAELQGRP